MRKAKNKHVEPQKINWIKLAPIAIVLACVAVVCIFLFGGGKKTIYLPEQVVLNDGSIMEFVYNAAGNLTEIRPKDGNGPVFEVTCNANGNVTKLTTQTAFDHTITREYTYSSKGNMLSCTSSNDGVVTEICKWEYNAYNQVTFSSVETISNGTSTLYKTMYGYTDDKKIDYTRTYLNDEEIYHTIYTYDTKGRLSVEELRDSKRDTVLVFVDYTFDQQGNTVAQVEYYVAGQKQSYTDTYDRYKNLTSREFAIGTTETSYEYTYKAIKVSKNSPRKSFTPFGSMPSTGLANSLI